MAWTFYELRFRLLSPLHVGHHKIGNIQRTRHYVPARTLWGAMTARLTRMLHPRATAEDYVTIGNQLAAQIAFTYLFPTNRDGQPLHPRYVNGTCIYGAAALSAEEFAWQYLGSYAATALDYERNAAAEASLHEVEFIAPQTRAGADQDGNSPRTSHPVQLLGYAVVAEGCELPWREALREIQAGGERHYGWGRLQLLASSGNQIGVGGHKLFGWLNCVAETSARPRLVMASREVLLAHTAVIAGGEAVAEGEIEPLVGRVWDKGEGAGQRIELTAVCYAPGAILKREAQQTLAMNEDHFWQMTS